MDIKNEICKAIGAAIAITMGVWCLLVVGTPLGAFLFALGLLTVCYFKLNLFTGMCGYVIDNRQIGKLLLTLFVNICAGYIFGLFIGQSDEAVKAAALVKVSTWNCDFSFYLRSIACGMIMFIAVDMFKESKSPLGIIFGIPLFILTGFQHSIANVITMGIAETWHWSIIICIIGNWIGSIVMWVMKGQVFAYLDKTIKK